MRGVDCSQSRELRPEGLKGRLKVFHTALGGLILALLLIGALQETRGAGLFRWREIERQRVEPFAERQELDSGLLLRPLQVQHELQRFQRL